MYIWFELLLIVWVTVMEVAVSGGSLLWRWLYRVGHCCGGGCIGWVTVMEVAVSGGSLLWRWLYRVGHCCGGGCIGWVTVMEVAVSGGSLLWRWLYVALSWVVDSIKNSMP
jgi:hypothetical protein